MNPEPLISIWAHRQVEELTHSPQTPLEWARRFVAACYSSGVPDDLPYISHNYSLARVVLGECVDGEVVAHGRISEETGAALVLRASTDRSCDDWARHLFFKAATEGWQLPRSMHDYALDVAAGASRERKRGDRYWKIRSRNIVGGLVLKVLTGVFKLNPSRSPATLERNSACDVLVEATAGLGWAAFTFDAAAKAWKDRNGLWTHALIIELIEMYHPEEKGQLAAFYLPLLDRLEAELPVV